MISYLSRGQIAQVDKIAVNKFGLSVEKMMENAGRGLARFVASLNPQRVFVFFGKGNNGGGGLVAVRHLLIYGFDIKIIGVGELNDIPKGQLNILKKMGVEEGRFDLSEIEEEDVIIDALIGYNLNGAPHGKFVELIEKINKAKGRVVSLDVPSGVDSTTGERFQPYVKADYVLALAMSKSGLMGIKNVYVMNIGIPNDVYKDIGIDVKEMFKKGDVVRVS